MMGPDWRLDHWEDGMTSIYGGTRAAWALLVGLSCWGCYALPEAPKPADNSTAVLGTNLNVVAYWSPELTGVDLFKSASPFFSGSDEEWEDARSLDLDEHGWVRSLKPGQLARAVMLQDGVRYPAGNYLVLYEGRGTAQFQYSGQTDIVELDGPGREVVALDPDKGGLSITILATQAGDYPRNFRVLIPGGTCAGSVAQWCDAEHPCSAGTCVPFESNHEEQLVNPAFISSVSSYGVLRFMDWMQTNGSTQRSWSDRPEPEDATWTAKGVPVEAMVELANHVDKDPWFCMPHAADDDYVRRFATYVRDNLEPTRKTYVEYSNEVWNGLFPQADYALEQGRRQRLGNSDFEAQLNFYALRTTEVHKIWEQVFGGSERLVRVTASQASNPWVSSTVLEFADTAQHTDVLAIAPYFGAELGEPDEQSRVERMNMDQMMAELRNSSLPIAIESMVGHAKVARANRVDLVAYEGGQHLVGTGPNVDSDRLNALFDAANRDPRIKDLYADYLRAWRKSGGHLFVHFTSCNVSNKWGRWGAREWMEQPRSAAPKFDAIVEYGEANPKWW
jgi:hypothetical protein